MRLDDYVTLGHSGLRVSPLCLGTMTFGEEWGWGCSVPVSEAILQRYLELGGNFIDTANVYTKGHAEAILGNQIGNRPALRRRLVLATKFFGNLYPGDPNGGGTHRKALLEQCEQSLRRLQTDYIDLYWMHCWDADTPIEETLRALDDLVRAGKVRYIGFSDTPAWKCAQAQTIAAFRGWAPLVALQLEYSLLQRSVESELVPMARELGMGVAAWSPLKSGVLSGKYSRDQHERHVPGRGAWATASLGPKTYALLDELREMARGLETSIAAVALAWVVARPGVSSTILGARTLEQLEENCAALSVRLGAAQLQKLDELTRPELSFPSDLLRNATAFLQGGATINGRTSERWRLAPATEEEVY